MKKALQLSLLALLCFSYPLAGQQDSLDRQPSNKMVDIQVKPEFPGGELALMQFLSDNMQYPLLAKENLIQGTVVVSFIIDQQGMVQEPVVLKDIGGGCGAEAIRVIQSMPTWKPGQANGHAVKVKYTLPMHFRLTGKSGDSFEVHALSEMPPRYSEAQTWELVRNAAEKSRVSGPIKKEAPFSVAGKEDRQFLKTLELEFATKLRKKDQDAFISLKTVSKYFYEAQFAPEFYTAINFSGKFARIMTPRQDFDLAGEGLGIILSLKVPKGVKVILYTKKKFKGQKLEIDASEAPLEIKNLGGDLSNIPGIRNENPAYPWNYNTQSVQIILPTTYPPK
ncbi:MAG: energy transducer TonB [Saprospiraceae bacterium]|nr:energy transducer TonB [Saprospiraceae bacterium]